jgi:hypothetical protein
MLQKSHSPGGGLQDQPGDRHPTDTVDIVKPEPGGAAEFVSCAFGGHSIDHPPAPAIMTKSTLIAQSPDVAISDTFVRL